MTNYWLVKSEPSSWSWQDQLDAGEQGTGWDGVRNYQASNNMQKMQLNDLAFFYHSVHEKQIVGIVRVSALYHPDPTDEKGRFGMVDVVAHRAFTHPVSLAQIKAVPEFATIALVKQSRLSVMPITKAEWQQICAMGDTDPD